MRNTSNIKAIEGIILSGGYITPKQAALYLGIKVKSLADYRSKGRRPAFIKRGNAVRYPAETIIDFITERNKAKSMPQYDHILSATLEHGS